MRAYDPYPGDCCPKKLTRLMFWLRVREVVNEPAFSRGSHLVLASREAGDVATLLGLGVPLEHITAVEWNDEEAELARAKFPGLSIYRGDVVKFALDRKRYYTSAFLDFCTSARAPDLERAAVVAENVLAPHGMLGVNFMAEREQSAFKTIKRQGYDKEFYDFEKSDIFVPRALYVSKQLRKRQPKLVPDSYFFYGDKNTRHGGHNWCVSLFSYGQVGRRLMYPKVPYFQVDADAMDIMDLARGLEREGRDARLLLNMPKRTIGALRANLAR